MVRKRNMLSLDLCGHDFIMKTFAHSAQGGGEVVLSAASLKPGACLPAFDLADRGDVASIRVEAFASGAVPAAAAEQMANAAERLLRVSFSETAEIAAHLWDCMCSEGITVAQVRPAMDPQQMYACHMAG